MIYVAFGDCGDEWLFRVDPSTMKCAPTPYRRSVSPDYKDCLRGLTFAADPASSTGESLYALGTGLQIVTDRSKLGYYLSVVDPATSAERVLGQLSGPTQASASVNIALAGTSQIWADYNAYPNNGVGTDIGSVSPDSATLSFAYQATPVPNAANENATRVFAASQSVFYLLERQATGGSTIHAFTPSTGALADVAQTSSPIFAAGAPSCD